MGTDMTMMVELKMDGQWVAAVLPLWPNGNFRETGEKPFGIAPQIPRHYALYSVLADVRNGHHRRGKVRVNPTRLDTGERWLDDDGNPIYVDYDMDDGGHEYLKPIDLPRGIPEDANPAWRAFVEDFEGAHDPTWYTLDELEGAPEWNQVINEQAVVLEEEYLAFRNRGIIPKMHARGVGGEDTRTVTVEEYENGERGKTTAVDLRWVGQTVANDVPDAWDATLAVAQLLAPDGDASRVRFLFVFDS